MIMIACVDERKGMMFNHRRQSRDSEVCRDILHESMGRKLYMSRYSSCLFEKTEGVEMIVSENILQQAEEEDLCFIEDAEIMAWEQRITKVILYQWNRRYPADTYFPLTLSGENWELARVEEFRGSSHERITKEVYIRRRKL